MMQPVSTCDLIKSKSEPPDIARLLENFRFACDWVQGDYNASQLFKSIATFEFLFSA